MTSHTGLLDTEGLSGLRNFHFKTRTVLVTLMRLSADLADLVGCEGKSRKITGSGQAQVQIRTWVSSLV